MKRNRLLLCGTIALLSIASGIFAGFRFGGYSVSSASAARVEGGEEAGDLEVNHPCLVFESETLEFGKALEGSRLTGQIKVRNTSEVDTYITAFQTPCACSAMVGDLPLLIPARVTIPLSFSLDTSRMVGRIRKVVAVYSDEAGKRREYRVELVAVSEPIVTLDRTTLEMGAIAKDETKVAVALFVVRRSSERPAPAPMRILRAPNWLNAELVAGGRDEDGREVWRLQCSASGASLIDAALDDDVVVQTPSTATPVIRVSVRARPLTTVSASPSSVSFGIVRAGDTPRRPSRLVHLRSIDGSHFSIRSAVPSSEVGCILVHVDTASATTSTEHDVRVSLITSGDREGFVEDIVRIVVLRGDGESETVGLPVRAYFKQVR